MGFWCTILLQQSLMVLTTSQILLIFQNMISQELKIMTFSFTPCPKYLLAHFGFRDIYHNFRHFCHEDLILGCTNHYLWTNLSYPNAQNGFQSNLGIFYISSLLVKIILLYKRKTFQRIC